MRPRAWLLATGAAALAATGLVATLWPPDRADASHPERAPSAPWTWIDVGWAGGDAGPAPADGRLGRLDGDESAPEGPMSFTVSPYGELFVLDQVNERLAVYGPDGAFLQGLTLPAPTFQDVEVTESGVLVVLDRLARRSLLLLSPDGKTLSEEAIEGEGVPEGGAVTGMFAETDGLWLEVGHQVRVRVLDADLRRGDRKTRAGRPTGEPGLSVGAALDGAGGAALWLEDEADGTILAERELVFPREVARIAWVEADGLGRLVAALHLWTWSADDPRRVAHEETAILVLDGWLGRVTELRSPHVATRWEQFRELKVTEDGAIHQLALSAEGARLFRWRASW